MRAPGRTRNMEGFPNSTAWAVPPLDPVGSRSGTRLAGLADLRRDLGADGPWTERAPRRRRLVDRHAAVHGAVLRVRRGREGAGGRAVAVHLEQVERDADTGVPRARARGALEVVPADPR